MPACSPAPLAPSTAPPPPKPPATIAGIERFMATAMRFVRIEPEAPTIIPATISAGLFSAIPVAAAERPVKAFSSEITTGMSAPPIGSTTALPSSAAQTSMPMKIAWECVARGDVHAGGDGEDQQHEVDDLLGRAER